VHSFARALDEARRRILTAQSERETESDGERDHDTREERLEERRDAQLIERREDREDPNGPLGDRAGKSGCAAARRFDAARHDALRDLRHHRRDRDDEDRNDDVSEERQETVLKEEGHRGQVEDLKREEQEDDDDEPLEEGSDELTGVQAPARAIDDIFDSRSFERVVDLNGLDGLRDDAADKDRDEPADDENDNGEHEIRDEVDGPPQEIVEGLLPNAHPALHDHIENTYIIASNSTSLLYQVCG
jgi:hypothetical protein